MTEAAQAVRAWREQCGLSQEDAARRLGVKLRNYQNYEAGKYAPPEPVRRLMTVIGLGLDPAPFVLVAPGAARRR